MKRVILVVQETDWIERGPHQSHHLLERLNPDDYEVHVIDFPLIWENLSRGKYPIIQGPRTLYARGKVIESSELKIHRSAFVNLPILNSLSVFLQRNEIRKQVKQLKPEIVVCFASLLNVNYIIRLCGKYKIPCVYYLLEKYYTMVPSRLGLLRDYAQWLESKAIRATDYCLVINEALKEYVDISRGAASKSKVIPGGVTLTDFTPNLDERIMTRSQLGISDDQIVLFYMGWLYKFSGLSEVVGEMLGGSKGIDRFKLMVIGRGDLWEGLRRIAERPEAESRIILLDWMPHSMIARYLNASDICILPAHHNEIMKDIVPIKVYEYMAAGKPVVATRLPGLVKEFGENNGVIYANEPSDVPYVALDLVERGALGELGFRSQRLVEKNDWRLIVKEFERIIDEMIDRKTWTNDQDLIQ
jgi:glycosyltransferase involved in cell wall biosynthesis